MIGSASRTFLVFGLAVAASGALAADPPQSASANEAAEQGQAADLRILALEELRRRANANELPAMEEIGRRLIQGLNAPKDPQAGAGWLLRAAEMGSVHAAFSVGVMYERGFVVARDSMRAVEWYRKAADGNVPMAKHNLALMLRDGKGTSRDGKAAVELLREAARQGMAASMFVLGDMYERGDAGSKDAIAALAWFSITAEFDRQTNRGNETPLVKAADQRSQTIQRTLTPGELLRAQGIAQSEFKQIVDALSPPKPAERIEALAAPPPPAVTDDEAVGWPSTAGEQVRATQQALVELKLLRDKPDGVLGPLTRSAIRDFQRNAGLRETGEPSKELYLALKVALRDVVERSPLPTPPKEEAKSEPQKDAPKPEAGQLRAKPEPPPQQIKLTTPEPPPPPTSTDLARADPNIWPPARGDQVRAIQKLLAELRYFSATPTGQVGPLTRAAIVDYQRTVGLKQTGEPSLELFESLKETRAKKEAKSEPPRTAGPSVEAPKPEPAPAEIKIGNPDAPPPPTSADIARADPDAWPAERSDQIRAVQRLLAELRYFNANPTGQVGPLTRAAIREYQRSVGLKETGEPSKELFESLKEVRALMAPRPR